MEEISVSAYYAAHRHCNICKKNFSNRQNLNRHLRNVHNKKPTALTYEKNVFYYRCLEENCDNSFRKNLDLVDHLKEKHNFNIINEDLEFKNVEAFKAWKEEIETSEMCNYVMPRGTRVTTTGETITYYVCNRSGKRPLGHNKNDCKSLKKSQGSKKLNRNCISQMTVIQHCNGIVCVTRQKTHYGHSKSIQHLRISQQSRQAIASKLVNGASESKILDMNRIKIGREVKRIDLLSRQDIVNIKRTFKLDITKGVKHDNDAVGIDSWVRECENKEQESPILFYKKRGDTLENFADSDFCLIIMNSYQEHMLITFGSNIIAVDSTHGYDFGLSIILIVDDYGEGFPIAYMFTNNEATDIHKHFFKCIKSKVGIVNTKTFMDDITDVFYNAWTSVMGNVTNRLYCAWYIDRAWQVDLTKIANRKKRNWAYETLVALQSNIDQKSFHENLQTFLIKLLEDNETNTFGLYFQTNYLNNYKQWAFCYQKQYGINTNMRLRSTHKAIKYFHLNKKCGKSLDKGLHAVLKYLQDRVVKHTNGEYTIRRKEIVERHRTALTSSTQVDLITENKWKVVHADKEYFVEKILPSKCCKLSCSYCNICLHTYTCNCDDFCGKFTICKHIHFVCIQKDKTQSVHFEENVSPYFSGIHDAVNNINYIKEEVICEISTINFNNISNEQLSQIVKKEPKEEVVKEEVNMDSFLNESKLFVSNNPIYDQVFIKEEPICM